MLTAANDPLAPPNCQELPVKTTLVYPQAIRIGGDLEAGRWHCKFISIGDDLRKYAGRARSCSGDAGCNSLNRIGVDEDDRCARTRGELNIKYNKNCISKNCGVRKSDAVSLYSVYGAPAAAWLHQISVDRIVPRVSISCTVDADGGIANHPRARELAVLEVPVGRQPDHVKRSSR
jgi:hypothetical protein